MTNDSFTLSGASALHALDADEQAAVDAAKADSPEFAAEIASLEETAALLADLAAETPPTGLRAAVMAEVDTVRQVRPTVAAGDGLATVHPLRAPGRGWVQRATGMVAAVAAIVAIGLGVTVANISARIDAVERSGADVAAVIVAEDAQRVTASLADGGQVSAVISPAHDAAVVVGTDLEPLTDDQMYALWAIVDGVPVPVGELVAGQPVAVHADVIGLTVEPRGALSSPTGDLQASLSV